MIALCSKWYFKEQLEDGKRKFSRRRRWRKSKTKQLGSISKHRWLKNAPRCGEVNLPERVLKETFATWANFFIVPITFQ